MSFTMRTGMRTLIAAAALLACVSANAEEEAKPGNDAAAGTPSPSSATSPAGEGSAGSAGSAWSAEVAPSGAGCIDLDDAQKETVKKVSDYFAALASLKGKFVQTGADSKRMRGKFYVQRPGKFRFDYNRPSRQVIISDGEYLAIQDLDLNNEDRIELDETPFRLLLKKDVDLIRDACINEVQAAEDLIVLGLRDKDPEASGAIRLFLAAKPELELKEWVTKDPQGQLTKVEVSNLDRTDDLKPDLFKIKPVNFNKFHP